MTRADRLERRYRWLLACYPAHHRAVYAEEMIGVLMSSSTPEQHRPDAGEALNLVVSGLGARFRALMTGAAGTVWREAVPAFAYLAVMVIATKSVYSILADRLGPLPLLTVTPHLSRTALVLAIGWPLVALAVALHRYRIAAVGTTLGALGQAISMVLAYADNPSQLVTAWWTFVLAFTATAALLAVWRAPTPDNPRALGIPTTIVLAIAGALTCMGPLVDRWTTVVRQVGPGVWETSSRIPLRLPMLGRPIAGLIMVLAVVIVVARLSPPTRRRVLLLAAPALATLLMITETFGGFLYSSPQFSPPVHLVIPQWISLVLVPCAVFAAGSWLLARYERKTIPGEPMTQPSATARARSAVTHAAMHPAGRHDGVTRPVDLTR